MSTNNAEISVNTMVTTCNGVDRHLLTGIDNSKGIKTPVSMGKTCNNGSTEAFTGTISW